MESHVNNHHRDTLQRIVSHPMSGNVEWREALSLLNAVGTVDQEPNGKFKVTVGPRPRFSTDLEARTSTRRWSSTCGGC